MHWDTFLLSGFLARFLGEFDGNRGWPIRDQVLHLPPGYVSVHQLKNGILIALFGTNSNI